ncbi:MAG: GNAT family N-acetyltransferase, partial [Thermomicrobiaceae bacterium]|nr:GNAT family N-acetyltransferase [Thermomicrobiaceae bacterium]
MSEIRVRPYEPRDAEAVHEVMTSPGVVAGTLQLPYQSLEEVRERFGRREPGLYSLVAEVDGRVVGTLTLRLERSPRRRHAAAFGMAVHDAYQGQGVGTALMAAMVDLADN